MGRPRRHLILAAATAAIAVGAFAAPASAADPRLALVNGIPGERVDVCFGNREVASRVRYGDWFQRVVAPGSLVVRFRRAAPGTCQGRVLASQALTLGADDDRTVVGTRRQDKVVWFVNDPVTVGPGAWLSFVRHAADVGPVVFTLSFDSPISPDALPPTFTKGDSDREQGTGQDSFWISATRPNQSEAMAERHVLVVEGRRGEVILVGDRNSNARFVIINRPTLPAP